MFRRSSRIFGADWTMSEPMLIPDGDDDGPVPPKEPPPKDGFNPAFFRPDRPRRRFERRGRHDRFRDRSRSREAGRKLWVESRLPFISLQWKDLKKMMDVWCGYQKLLDMWFYMITVYHYIMLCTNQVGWSNFVKRDLPQFILQSLLGTHVWYDMI